MTRAAEHPGIGTTAPAVLAARDWRRAYAQRLIIGDFVVIVFAVFFSQLLWTAIADDPLLRFVGRETAVPYAVVSFSLVVVWVALLAFFATREQRYLGEGSSEYRLVVAASFRLFAFVLLVIFIFKLNAGRGALITAFVIGVGALLLERWLWRRWLVAQRREGRMMTRVLLAGSVASVAHLAQELARAKESGYKVVGVCIPKGESSTTLEELGIPVLGGLDNITSIMELHDADTLAIGSTGHLGPQKVRELSWQLEPGRQHLVLAPSLTDVGGPRIRMRPVNGLPLIHVETPRFERGEQAVKRTVDIVASTLLLVVLSPILLAIAIAVRAGSPGPILFRQTRVGLNGETFSMLKFRSMVVDAEARLARLSELDREEGNVVMFKMRDDPRITKVGAFLRRYSLDELPQLWNVFIGSMSLIGPRPPLEEEVEMYEKHVHRRFLMKPGITGLWQVSGRSNLSWEDTVRLDLYYVENWSLIGDVVILWRTAKAVLDRDGAY